METAGASWVAMVMERLDSAEKAVSSLQEENAALKAALAPAAIEHPLIHREPELPATFFKVTIFADQPGLQTFEEAGWKLARRLGENPQPLVLTSCPGYGPQTYYGHPVFNIDGVVDADVSETTKAIADVWGDALVEEKPALAGYPWSPLNTVAETAYPEVWKRLLAEDPSTLCFMWARYVGFPGDLGLGEAYKWDCSEEVTPEFKLALRAQLLAATAQEAFHLRSRACRNAQAVYLKRLVRAIDR